MASLNNNIGTPKLRAKLEMDCEKCREEGESLIFIID